VTSSARLADGSINEHDGQVWFYDPSSQTITLKTIFGVNPSPAEDNGNFDGPDNITVSTFPQLRRRNTLREYPVARLHPGDHGPPGPTQQRSLMRST
jgi:hypothetical protein